MAEWLLFSPREAEECGLWAKGSRPPVFETASGADTVRVLGTADEISRSWESLRYHLFERAYRVQFEHGEMSTLPRAHVYRPYRLCVRDVLMGAIVIHTSQVLNACEVDALLVADVPELAPLAAAEAAILFMLSDAVKTGASLAIQFSEQCAGGPVPSVVRDVCAKYGIGLERAEEGKISPVEGRRLYLELSQFRPEVVDRLRELHMTSGISIERICYLVHHGLWEIGELETIVLGAAFPEEILLREVGPEEGLIAQLASFHGRSALLGGYLQGAMSVRSHRLSGDAVEQRDNDRIWIDREFAPESYARSYCPHEDVLLDGWLPNGETCHLEAGRSLQVLLRGWSLGEIRLKLAATLERAAETKQGEGARTAVAVPYDYYQLGHDESNGAYQKALSLGVALLVCPLKHALLDDELRRRMRLGEHVRV